AAHTTAWHSLAGIFCVAPGDRSSPGYCGGDCLRPSDPYFEWSIARDHCVAAAPSLFHWLPDTHKGCRGIYGGVGITAARGMGASFRPGYGLHRVAEYAGWHGPRNLHALGS